MARRRSDRPTVEARAWVVPGQAVNDRENVSNLSADSEVRTRLLLEVRTTADGRPGPPGVQRVEARMANWLRLVCEHAGTNHGPADRLPPEVLLPVVLDAETRAVVAVDVDRAGQELAAHRDVARDWWRRTEAPLADVRGALGLPGAAVRAGRGLWGEVRSLGRDVAGLFGSGGMAERPRDPVREEQIRRTAAQLRARYALHPDERATIEAGLAAEVEAHVANRVGGSIGDADLEEWIILRHGSGLLSDDDVAALRRRIAEGLAASP